MYQKHNWVTKEVIRREYLQNIEDGIYNEEQRAIDAETLLQSNIGTETSRAVGKENELAASITSLTNNLSAEVSRATTRENAIESAFDTALNAEIDRATGAEGDLADLVSDLSDSVSDEVTRATAAESALSTSISDETTRATGAESALSTSIGAETTRAETAEGTLQTNISSETTRATTAESTLQTNISNERARAQQAESTLSGLISTETTRATAAESSLHDYIDQEITRVYKPSGSVFFADLPALVQSRLGNVYDIKDAFTTTSDFTDGEGIKYPAGTNVAIINSNGTLKYDCLPGHNVTGVKGDAENDYRIGAVNITKANIGLGNVGNFKAVSTVASQGLTDTEKSNARTNISAASTSAATSSANGLMPKADKAKLDGMGMITYGTCSTDAATAAKEVTISNTNWQLKVGSVIGVKFSVTNTASNITLNVNSTGAKSIYYNNAAYTGSSSDITGYANRTNYYMYDGTYWVFLHNGIVDSNTRYDADAVCTTAADKAAKAASATSFVLRQNCRFILRITTTNTAASALTLNVNNTGAKPLYINNAASSDSNYTLPAGDYFVYYNGTNYYLRTDNYMPGNIDGTAINVRETVAVDHGGTGATTAAAARTNLGLGNVGNFKAVSTVANQGLTEAEKQAARANIGAGSESQTVTVDTALSTTSENPVQNKVITNDLNTRVKKYALSGYNNKYCKLGTCTNFANSKHLELHLKWAQGYGTQTNANQQKVIDIYVGAGNNTTAGNNSWAEYHVVDKNINNSLVYIKWLSYNSFELYIGKASYNGTGYYTIISSDGITWTHSNSDAGTDIPDGAIRLAADKKVRYMDDTISYSEILGTPLVDSTPTSGSSNLITSGGVYSYIDTMITQALADSY